MLDLRLEANIVVARQSRQGGVSVGALGDQLLCSCFRRGRILRYGWLDSFHSKPVRYSSLDRCINCMMNDIPVNEMSLGTLGKGALINFSKSTSSSSI